MIKLIITTLIISSTYAYPYEEENKYGSPVESAVPETKPITPAFSHVEVPNVEERANDAEPEESDLKTDATFWPWPVYRSYHSYRPYYRHYRPRVYYRYYYW